MKNILNTLFAPSKPLWQNKPLSHIDRISVRTIENQNAIIQEIHDTFYSEVDRILAEANISNSLETDKQALIDKCKNLRSLGFASCPEVVEGEKEIRRLDDLFIENLNKAQLIDDINYFSFKYPQYKFITEESVKKICQKYNLVYSTVDIFIGKIPNENVSKMLQFKISDEDACYQKEYFGRLVGNTDVIYNSFEDHKENIEFSEGCRSSYGYYRLCKSPLEIVAPFSDFKTKGKELVNFKLTDIHIPDPIVLQPVYRGGVKHYLIVTAWGLEASDELVVNERNN